MILYRLYAKLMATQKGSFITNEFLNFLQPSLNLRAPSAQSPHLLLFWRIGTDAQAPDLHPSGISLDNGTMLREAPEDDTIF